MKREWILPRFDGGSERAVQLGQALGIIAAEETVESLTQLLSLMDRIGGQAYFNAIRVPFDAQGNQLTEEEAQERKDITWETRGYRVVYESRDVRIIGKMGEPPDAIELSDEPSPDEEQNE